MENGLWNRSSSTNRIHQNFPNFNALLNDVSSPNFIFGGHQPSYTHFFQFQQPSCLNEIGDQLYPNSSNSFIYNQNRQNIGFQNLSPPVLLNNSNQDHHAHLLDCLDSESGNGNFSNQVKLFISKDSAQDNVRSELQPKEGSVKSTPIKGQWNAQEDSLLKELVKQYGEKNWTCIARMLPGRVGKQCRDRWNNHLREDIKKDEWSEEEDRKLIELHKRFGKKWTTIAREMPERSENNIKNHWNSTGRRKYPNRKRSLVLYKYINSVTSNLSASTSTNTPFDI